MNRICRTCKEEKALQENYYKSKKSPGGYHTKCKACCKAYHQEYHKQTYKPNPRKLKYPYLESSLIDLQKDLDAVTDIEFNEALKTIVKQ